MPHLTQLVSVEQAYN